MHTYYIVNYIYKQIHIEKNQNVLYSFIETYFLTNENPYGRSLSSRRHTYVVYKDGLCFPVCHPISNNHADDIIT